MPPSRTLRRSAAAGAAESRGGTNRRNTVFAFAVQISTAACTAALTLVLLRVLGSHAYGQFALALAIGSLVLLPADFGLSGAAARFLAEAKGSRRSTHVTLVSGFQLKLAISVAASGGLFLLAGPIAAAYGEPGLAWPLRGMAVAVLGQGVMRFCVVCFSARERNSLSFLVVTGESVAELAASVALVVVWGGAAAAAFGRAVGYGIGTALAVVTLVRLFDLPVRKLVLARADRKVTRRLATYGGAMAIADGVWAAFSQVDILLIGAILTTTAAGIFQAPLRLLVLASYPGLALGASIGPRLARTRTGRRPDPAPLVAAVRGLLVVQTLAAAVVIGWAVPLTRTVLGSGYEGSARVFAALGPYIVLSGLAPLLSNAITYVGGTRARIRVALVSLAINVVLDVVLLPWIGVVGAAIGTDVGYTVYVGGHVLIGARLLGYRIDRIVATLIRCTVALVPTVGILLVGATLGPLALAPAALIAVAVYAAVLHVLGESTIRPWVAAGSRRPRLRRAPAVAEPAEPG